MKTIDNISQSEIDEFYKLIGRNVKKYRNKKKISQLQMSLNLNLKSVGLISQGELYINKQHFNLKHLYQIAYVLDCKVEDFFS